MTLTQFVVNSSGPASAARRLRVGRMTIQNWLKGKRPQPADVWKMISAGITDYPAPVLPNTNSITLEEFVKQSGSIKEAAKKIGVGVSTVQKQLDRTSRGRSDSLLLFARAGIAGYVLVPVGYKRCPTCNVAKLLDQFHFNRQKLSGREPWCMDCKLTKNAQHYAATKEGSIRKHKEYNNSLHGRFLKTKNGARARHISFFLTEEEYILLRTKSCFVVNCARIVTGLDRIDSNKGYAIDNSRPSCERHNEIKNDMSDEETYQLCKEYISWFEQRK